MFLLLFQWYYAFFLELISFSLSVCFNFCTFLHDKVNRSLQRFQYLSKEIPTKTDGVLANPKCPNQWVVGF